MTLLSWVICSGKHELWFNHCSLSVQKVRCELWFFLGFFPYSHLTYTDFHLTILNWAHYLKDTLLLEGTHSVDGHAVDAKADLQTQRANTRFKR